MRTSLIHLVVILASLAAMGQQPAPSANPPQSTSQALPPNAASREQILKLFNMMNMRKTTETTIQIAMLQAKANAEQLFRQQTPDATPQQVKQFQETMEGIMDDAFGSMPIDQMFEIMIPVYQRHFTTSDIDAMVAFYSSPTGQKMLNDLPQIMQESMQAMGPMQLQMMQDIVQKTNQRMQKMNEQKKDQDKSSPRPSPRK